jgi:eukaryotic-like serine/threonine-protein kinase
VLEDVHWGDLPSLRFVDAGLRRVRDQGWIVLALARPDVHDTFPRLWADRRVREMRLEELSRGSAERLVVQVLGEQATPATVKRLVDRAAGIPFYLEELIRSEVRGNGTVDPPETLLAMLQARLERLEAETRRVLRAASVFGETFHPQAVTLLCGADTDVSAAMRELEEHELIERRTSARLRDDEEFVFRHGLVREAAYATLTESDRRLGHRLAAQWLEEHGESDAMTLAEHCERGQNGAGAARWFVSASEQALRANDLDAVIARADRGIACGAEGETLGALRLLQSEAQLWRGELASAERYVILAMEHLPQGGTRWYRAALGLLMQSASSGRESKSAHVIAELAAAARSERSAAQTMAFALALRLRTMENDLEGAKPFFAHLQTIDREVRDRPELTAMVPGGLFYWWSYVDFDPWLRKQCAERCARESHSVGDAMNSAMASVHIGWANIALGAYEEAERVLTSTLEHASERGFGHLIGDFARLYLGAALARLGRLEEARSLELETTAKLFEAGNWLYGGLARAELARILFEMGQCDAARHEARSACEVLARVPAVQVGALAIHSRIALAAAEPQQALELAQTGARILDAHGCVTESEVCLRLSLSDALAATNHARASALELERASRSLESRAERIVDASWRRSFVGRVAENVEVVERCAGSSRSRIS